MVLNECMSTTMTSDATAARLERLAARRTPQTGTTRTGTTRPVAAPRRGKPARGAKAAALAVSVASTGGLAFLFSQGASASAQASTISATPVALQVTSATTATTTAGATATATGTGGTVAGAVETNRFGNVQVQATFSSTGALTAVTVLQTPTDNRSVSINSRAVPVLNAEAVAAQSASINSVSGATYTSNSYQQSLQSAIDAARAAGITTLA